MWILSWLLGCIDNIFERLTTRNNYLFGKGVGDHARYQESISALYRCRRPVCDQDPTISVNLDTWTQEKGVWVAQGSFLSPAHALLPQESDVQQANFKIVLPTPRLDGRGDFAISSGRVPACDTPWVIHFPAAADEYYALRFRLLAVPLAAKGIGSVLLQIPFYGDRRPKSCDDYLLATMEQFGQQIVGAVMEAHAIARWLKESQGCSGPIVFTGFSYGAHFAAVASMCAYEGLDHGVVTLSGAAHQLGVFTDGVLARGVDVSAFKGGRDEFASLMLQMDLAGMGGDDGCDGEEDKKSQADPLPRPKRVSILLAAEYDKYVTLAEAERLANAMAGARGTVSSRLEVLPGGHVTLCLFYRQRYLDAIAEAAMVCRNLEK